MSFDAQPAADADEDVDRGTYLELLTNQSPGPVARLEEKERREWVRRSVQELPPLLRSAVLLVYYQGLKYREVAEIQHIGSCHVPPWTDATNPRQISKRPSSQFSPARKVCRTPWNQDE